MSRQHGVPVLGWTGCRCPPWSSAVAGDRIGAPAGPRPWPRPWPSPRGLVAAGPRGATPASGVDAGAGRADRSSRTRGAGRSITGSGTTAPCGPDRHARARSRRKVEGWVSNSRVASHALPRRSSLVVAGTARASRRTAEVIASADESQRCRERRRAAGLDGRCRPTRREPAAKARSAPGRSPPPVPTRSGAGGADGRLPEHRPRRDGAGPAPPRAPAFPLRRLRPLLGLRAVELHLGAATLRDPVVPMDREQYLAQPQARPGPTPPGRPPRHPPFRLGPRQPAPRGPRPRQPVLPLPRAARPLRHEDAAAVLVPDRRRHRGRMPRPGRAVQGHAHRLEGPLRRRHRGDARAPSAAGSRSSGSSAPRPRPPRSPSTSGSPATPRSARCGSTTSASNPSAARGRGGREADHRGDTELRREPRGSARALGRGQSENETDRPDRLGAEQWTRRAGSATRGSASEAPPTGEAARPVVGGVADADPGPIRSVPSRLAGRRASSGPAAL